MSVPAIHAPETVALRRRQRARATKRFASRVQPGDFVHTASDVFEVIGVATGLSTKALREPRLGLLVRGTAPSGERTQQRRLMVQPGHSLTVFRP